jgi:prephenate dehydrogenase
MKESFEGEVTGGHPVFGPVDSFEGKRFVLCKAREGNYYGWYKGFLEELGCKVFEMGADEHDRIMAIVQCMNHFSNFSTGYAMEKTGLNLKEIDKLASPNYNLRLYPIGRVLMQDASLYSDILTENPYSKEFNRKFVEASNELLEAIENNDKEKIESIIAKTKNYFGELSEKSLEITNKILSGF